MSWIHELLEGRQEEQKLRDLQASIEAAAREARTNPAANLAVRLTRMRAQHYGMTGSGGPS